MPYSLKILMSFSSVDLLFLERMWLIISLRFSVVKMSAIDYIGIVVFVVFYYTMVEDRYWKLSVGLFSQIAGLEFFVLDLLTDEGVEGGGLLELGKDLLEVGESGGVVHESVDSFF